VGKQTAGAACRSMFAVCHTEELPAMRTALRSSRQLSFAGKGGDVITGKRRKFRLKNYFPYYLCDAQVTLRSARRYSFAEVCVCGAFNQDKAYQDLANNASLR
jgi:hypothetical protein